MKNLELLHKECSGGKVSIRAEHVDNFLSVLPLNWAIIIRCQGCECCVELPDSLEEEIKNSIVKTAIDGQERKINNNIVVTRRFETKPEEKIK